jgi:hypothetical protein
MTALLGEPLDQLHPIAPFEVDWELAFPRPICRAALRYWFSVAGERAMPRRTELRPEQMRQFLAHVNLVDVHRETGGPDYEVRLQGLHGQGVFGSLTRRRLGEYLEPVTEERLRRAFGLVVENGRPMRASGQVTAGGKSWLRFEALVAPLGHSGAPVDGLFWVLDSWRPA